MSFFNISKKIILLFYHIFVFFFQHSPSVLARVGLLHPPAGSIRVNPKNQNGHRLQTSFRLSWRYLLHFKLMFHFLNCRSCLYFSMSIMDIFTNFTCSYLIQSFVARASYVTRTLPIDCSWYDLSLLVFSFSFRFGNSTCEAYRKRSEIQIGFRENSSHPIFILCLQPEVLRGHAD